MDIGPAEHDLKEDSMTNENTPNNADAGSLSAGDFKTWLCILCGFIYDEAQGMPQDGIAPGTRWADVPDDWVCPDCSAMKIDFELVQV